MTSELKKRLEVLNKQTDDWKNNQFTHRNGFAINHMLNMPKIWERFERDKGDVGNSTNLALPNKTKRKRKRQITSPTAYARAHPKKGKS